MEFPLRVIRELASRGIANRRNPAPVLRARFDSSVGKKAGGIVQPNGDGCVRAGSSCLILSRGFIFYITFLGPASRAPITADLETRSQTEIDRVIKLIINLTTPALTSVLRTLVARNTLREISSEKRKKGHKERGVSRGFSSHPAAANGAIR